MAYNRARPANGGTTRRPYPQKENHPVRNSSWSQLLFASAALVAALAGCQAAGRDLAAQASPRPGFYALYVAFDWDKGYLDVAADIKAVGIRDLLTSLRLDKPLVEQSLLRAAQDGMNVTASLQPGRKDFQEGFEPGLANYLSMVRRTVSRYGSGGTFWKEHPEVPARPVRHWLVGGEPNIEMMVPPEGMDRVELYARLLTAASAEIRKIDPTARIIAFNTSDGAPHHGRGLRPDSLYQGYVGWRRFIHDVNEKTGTAVYDIVGTHPYHQPLGPEDGGIATGVEMVRELAGKQGFQDKPLWFTEIGYPTVYPNNKQVRDERQQASFLVRMFAIAAAHGVGQVQVMYVRDILHAATLPGQGETQRNFGFFFEPGKWKEQAVATRVMTRLLPDPRREVTTLHEEPKGVHAYCFQGLDDLSVIMAWHSAEGSEQRQFSLPLGKFVDATCVDMLGKDVRPLAVSQDGKVTVTLGEAPVYIVPAAEARVRAVLAAP